MDLKASNTQQCKNDILHVIIVGKICLIGFSSTKSFVTTEITHQRRVRVFVLVSKTITHAAH